MQLIGARTHVADTVGLGTGDGGAEEAEEDERPEDRGGVGVRERGDDVFTEPTDLERVGEKFRKFRLELIPPFHIRKNRLTFEYVMILLE